jgi:acetyl esterase
MGWEDVAWDVSDLDPEMRAAVEQGAESKTPPIHSLSVAGAREVVAEKFGPPDDAEPVESVYDTEIPGTCGEVDGASSIPVRIYTPGGEGPFPVMLWFHGGGFVLGGPDIADSICRHLANAGECVVVSVDYRRAPEHPFPAALLDCYAATAWAAAHAEAIGGLPGAIGVGGGSAGGNLAATVSMLARDLGAPDIAYQWVVYPMVDDDFTRESHREAPGGRTAPWYWNHYLSTPVDRRNPYALPLKASDLSGLPPAEVLTVEFDVFRDEGVLFADALADAGCEVEHVHHDDAIHPFLNMDFEASAVAIEAAAERFRDVVDG